MIVGVTDHAVTAGDHKFEGFRGKVHLLNETTQQIAALLGGDLNAQIEVCGGVRRNEPKTVEDAVDAYCRHLTKFNRVRGERRFLAPLGLSMRSFVQGQHGLSDRTVEQLHYDLKCERAAVQTIICGLDSSGAHIYSIDSEARAECCDGIGFAAIGDGQWHAASQLMFARYDPIIPLDRALLLLHYAKYRAEAAPGVGYHSSYFVIDRQLRGLADQTLAALNQAGDIIQGVIQVAWEEQVREFRELMASSLIPPKQAADAAAPHLETEADGSSKPKANREPQARQKRKRGQT
ncbi:MAG TPA: hypothetical protein PKC18_06040 [Lacipirellulaceae bacterium]|nr:hypothetical protein [Lacipirellulaceae bacterium]